MEAEKHARGIYMERREVDYLTKRIVEGAKKADLTIVEPELNKLVGMCWDGIISYVGLREWIRDKYNIQVNDWELPKEVIEYRHQLDEWSKGTKKNCEKT